MGIINSIKTWWNSMTPAEKVGTIFRGITTGIIATGTVICIKEVRESRALISYAVDTAADGVEVEVSDELVQDAVGKAANEQVRKVVRNVVSQTESQIRADTNELVDLAVRESRKHITDAVTTRLADNCKKISEQDIMREIREQATEKLAEKLDKNLDAITDEYSKNLSNMGKVYEALADKLQSKA